MDVLPDTGYHPEALCNRLFQYQAHCTQNPIYVAPLTFIGIAIEITHAMVVVLTGHTYETLLLINSAKLKHKKNIE